MSINLFLSSAEKNVYNESRDYNNNTTVCGFATGVMYMRNKVVPKLADVKNILNAVKPQLMQKYHVSEIGIFGSSVREQQNTRSDIDILVDFDSIISAFTFINLKEDLTDKLGVKVDLVSKKALKPRIGKNVLQEVTYI
jgi:predicted nucleotidyltransferase